MINIYFHITIFFFSFNSLLFEINPSKETITNLSPCEYLGQKLTDYLYLKGEAKDSMWQVIISERNTCLDTFYYAIAKPNYNYFFSQEEVNQLRDILNDSIDLSNLNAVKAAGLFNAKQHQYAIAKLADPDFFDELRLYIQKNEIERKRIFYISGIKEKSIPHIALANLGDTIVEDSIINILKWGFSSLLDQFQNSESRLDSIERMHSISTFIQNKFDTYLTPIYTRRSIFETLEFFDYDINADHLRNDEYDHSHSFLSYEYFMIVIYPKLIPLNGALFITEIGNYSYGVRSQQELKEYNILKRQLIKDIRTGKMPVINIVR